MGVASKKPTTLVLLTRNFPSPEGDYAFLRNEICYLAKSYDRVLVFPYIMDGGPPVDLPANVEYHGRLWEATSAEGWRQILRPTGAWRALRALATEWHSGRLAMVGSRLTVEAVAHGTKFAARILGTLGSGRGEITVYSFWGTGGALALPFLPKRFRKIVRVHGHDLYEDPDYPLRLRAAIHSSVDLIATISEHGKTHLEREFPDLSAQRKIVTSRLGSPDGGRGPTPTPGEPWTIVSCAYARDIKRLDLVLATVAEVSKAHPTRWVHFGGGAGEEKLKELAAAAEAGAPRLSVELRGDTPNQAIHEFYREHAVNAFVSLSSTEGLPVSIMEALSYGIPVVATDVGGTAELVGETLGSGILLPPDPTVNEAARAIVRACEGRSEFDPRRVWKERTDAERAAKRIVSILRGVRSPLE